MLNAMLASSGGPGTCTTPRVARLRVIECASVKAVTVIMHRRRAREPPPDEYYRLPQWPPLRVHPLDQYGLPDHAQSPYKPKIERSMLNNIRRAAPSIGKIVGKGEIRQRDPTVTGATLGSRPLSST